MSVKNILVVWDSETYANRQEAEADGAVGEYHIPSTVTSIEEYVHAFMQGLAVAGARLFNYGEKLSAELVTLKPFSVSGKVLEWNEYTVTVWATDEGQALQTVKDGSLVSHHIEDVTYGVEAASKAHTSEKEIHING